MRKIISFHLSDYFDAQNQFSEVILAQPTLKTFRHA